MTSSRALLLASLLVGLAPACARDVSPTGATPTDAPSQAQHEAAPTAGTQTAAASHAGQGAHAGCIYTGTNADGAGVCGQSEPDAPSQSSGHFGAPFSVAAAVPLTAALGANTQDAVLVSGTVEAVCQKKGCWMVVKDGTNTARVMMKDHAFAVPIDSRGKPVLVEGQLTKRTFDEAQVKHLEQDRGGDPNAVSGARDEHVLMATAVEIES